MLNFYAYLPEPLGDPAATAPAGEEDSCADRCDDQPAAIALALRRIDALIAGHGEWLKRCHLEMLATAGARSARPSAFTDFDREAWRDLLEKPVFVDCKARVALADALNRMIAGAGRLSAGAGAADPASRVVDYGRFMDAVLAFQAAVREVQAEAWNLLANIDSLTGLGNRQAMFHRLSVECERHARSRSPCSLAMIDLDAFKPINDRHGHAAGDVVLGTVAAALADSIRPYDALFRYGGDEFALCLPNTDTRSAWAIVERLRSKIAGLTIRLREHAAAETSMSAGIAPLTSEFGVHAALEAADAALYRAKGRGRNAIYVWSPDS